MVVRRSIENLQSCCYAGHWAQELHASGSREDVEALELAIALSQRSNHPVSRALTSLDSLLHQSGASLSERISDFRAVPGMHGITCVCICAQDSAP